MRRGPESATRGPPPGPWPGLILTRYPLLVSTGPRSSRARTRAKTYSSERYRWQIDGNHTSTSPHQEVTNSTGRVFRVGEKARRILGYDRWVVITTAAWLAMCLARLFEYTWGALSG